MQVFVTSHSPNFASIAKLSSLSCLVEVDSQVESFHPRAVVFAKGKREKLERYLDVTRAELFFARRVIFVEGAAELLIVNQLAKRIGVDLKYHGVSLISVEGLILRALSRRYPHILVDEAQDIGREHQVVLELLIKAGSQVSLIGDQHQGIYDFSGASGEFLAGYGEREDVSLHNLTTNYRSVPSILNVANNLAGRNDSAERAHPAVLNGAFYLPYSKSEKSKALAAFKSLLDTAELDHRDAVVLCRSTQWVEDWRGGEEEQGQGIVRSFVNATISRDKLHRHGDAFDQGCMGLIGLLDAGQITLRDMIKRGGEPNTQQLRRAIWSFIRDSSAGLPAGTLLADTEWHPALVDRVKRFLVRLEREFSLKPAANIGNKLAKKELSNRPIVQLPDLAAADIPTFRVSTVHQVKGESIDAVMYVADRSQIQSLIGGTGTEVGRIGYVAVTRARNLFVLGVPDKHIKGFEPDLQRLGFKKLGA